MPMQVLKVVKLNMILAIVPVIAKVIMIAIHDRSSSDIQHDAYIYTCTV